MKGHNSNSLGASVVCGALEHTAAAAPERLAKPSRVLMALHMPTIAANSSREPIMSRLRKDLLLAVACLFAASPLGQARAAETVSPLLLLSQTLLSIIQNSGPDTDGDGLSDDYENDVLGINNYTTDPENRTSWFKDYSDNLRSAYGVAVGKA